MGLLIVHVNNRRFHALLCVFLDLNISHCLILFLLNLLFNLVNYLATQVCTFLRSRGQSELVILRFKAKKVLI